MFAGQPDLDIFFLKLSSQMILDSIKMAKLSQGVYLK